MSSLNHHMQTLALANNPYRERNDESDDEEERQPRKQSSSKASSKASSRASSRDSRYDSESSIPMDEDAQTDEDLKRKPTVTQRFPATKGRPSTTRKEIQTMMKAMVGDLGEGKTTEEVKNKYEILLNKSLTLENTPLLVQDGIKLRESYSVDDETVSMNAILRDLRLSSDGSDFVDSVKTGSNEDLTKRLERVQIDILQVDNTLKNLKVAKKVLQYHLAGRNDIDICALDILLAIWKKKMYELMA